MLLISWRAFIYDQPHNGFILRLLIMQQTQMSWNWLSRKRLTNCRENIYEEILSLQITFAHIFPMHATTYERRNEREMRWMCEKNKLAFFFIWQLSARPIDSIESLVLLWSLFLRIQENATNKACPMMDQHIWRTIKRFLLRCWPRCERMLLCAKFKRSR